MITKNKFLYPSFIVVIVVDSKQFMRVYTSLPDNERELTIVVVDGEPYSWKRAYLEIREDTGLGKEILKKLAELKII